MPNPYFTRNQVFASPKPARAGTAAKPDQLEATWNAPAATPFDTGRMSYEGTVLKTSGLLILLFCAAAVTWLVAPALAFVGMLVGFVLALIIIFRKKPSPALTIAYAVAEGVFLGGFSAYIESVDGYQGIPLQALLATGITASVCLWLYRSGRVRVTAGFTRVMMVGMISYGIFCIANLIVMLTTSDPGRWNPARRHRWRHRDHSRVDEPHRRLRRGQARCRARGSLGLRVGSRFRNHPHPRVALHRVHSHPGDPAGPLGETSLEAIRPTTMEL
jgi:hypothetical protein